MTRLTLFIAIASLLAPFSIQAEELSATLISRTTGDAETGKYRNGGTGPGKGNFGFAKHEDGTDYVNVKGILVFDALPVMQEMVDQPAGELELAFDWNKGPETVKDVKIYFVGAFPNIEVKDSIFYHFYMKEGVEVGEISASELESLPSRKIVNVELDEVAPGGDVSPANRYLVYRFEVAEGLEDGQQSNMIGLASDASEHQLFIGEAAGGSKGGAGGYLK